ncbi:Uncharacterised protein [Escherichia coli]|nr:Uncharacterised protein [Escherichia coli]
MLEHHQQGRFPRPGTAEQHGVTRRLLAELVNIGLAVVQIHVLTSPGRGRNNGNRLPPGIPVPLVRVKVVKRHHFGVVEAAHRHQTRAQVIHTRQLREIRRRQRLAGQGHDETEILQGIRQGVGVPDNLLAGWGADNKRLVIFPE